MIKAFLLDLDNTLLKNPDRTFALEYLRLADDFFMQHWQTPDFSQLLVKSVKAMSAVRDMRQTNTGLHVDIVMKSTQRTIDDITGGLSAFYTEAYHKLKSFTAPLKSATDLVNYLNASDYAVVIATNPLYPAEAIQQRLTWAGLPSDFDHYTFVTHADNMHFAKPDMAYYAEILARVGIEPDEAMMVGDSYRNDIEPAHRLGIHTFHVTPSANGHTHGDGTLTDFYRKITETNWLNSLLPKPLIPDHIEPQLRGNMGALYGLLDQVKPDFWDQHPDPNEWSIIQIVCHLLESEEQVQRPRLQQILHESNPFLANPKTPPGPKTAPCDTDGMRVADRLLEERRTTINFLHTLSEDDWQRPARHSIFGPTTLLEMAHFTAQHDRLHLNQLCQTMGNCE